MVRRSGRLTALAAWGGLTELWDKFVGPEIFRESPSLFVQWHLALGMAVAGSLAGVLWTRKGRSPGTELKT